jgi:hypothetical protein
MATVKVSKVDVLEAIKNGADTFENIGRTGKDCGLRQVWLLI